MQIGVRQSAPTYNYEIDNAELDERQKIARAMMQGSLAPMPTEVVSGVAVRRSPLEALGKLGQSFMAGQELRDVKKGRTELQNEYTNDISEGMAKLQTGMTGGKTAVVGEMGPELKEVPADPKTAIAEALAHRNPVVRDYAMKQQAELAKRAADDRKAAFDAASPQSRLRVLQGGGGIEALTPEQKVGYDADGNIVEYRTVKGPDGRMYQEHPQTKKLSPLDTSTKVSVSNTINPNVTLGTGQREGSKEAFGMAAKAVQKLADTYEATGNMKNLVGTARELDSKGIFSGKGAGVLTDAAGWAKAFGVPLTPEIEAKLSNSETYNSGAEQLAQAFLRTIDGNKFLTGPEAADAKKAIVNQRLSPEARQNLYNLMDTAHARAEKLYLEALPAFNAAVKAEDPTLFDYGKFLRGTQGQNATQVPNPEVGTQTTPAAAGPTPVRRKLTDKMPWEQ